MRPSFFPKTHIAKVLIVLLLLVLLTGCGSQNQPANSSNSTPTPISSSPTSNPSDNLSPNIVGISIDQANLHIDASDGIKCPLGTATQGPPDNPGPIISNQSGNNLVLATNRLTYDSNEIQQMQDYVNNIHSNSVQMPNTLRWVLGGPIDTNRILNINGSASGHIDDCGVHFQLTNTGQDLIQVASIGVQLTEGTQQNNYQYRLIDVCTLVQCMVGGGGGSCSLWYATIKLAAGSTNAVFSASPIGSDPSCGELTLNPGQEEDLYVSFYSPQNLIYSIVPQLTLDTSNGPNTLTLTELTSTLAFANGSQFTCYGLQGDTFTPETTPPPNSECI